MGYEGKIETEKDAVLERGQPTIFKVALSKRKPKED
jgi:hypothetical protein